MATIVALTGLGVLLSLRLGVPHAGGMSSPLVNFPHVVLWAWERPEDLRFIDPGKFGVAFLAQTVYLRGGTVTVRPRRQPLLVPPGTVLMAVVRIESAPDADGAYRHISLQSEQAAVRIADVSHMPGVIAVQVDFDAKESERDFYDGLLRDAGRGLPDGMPLSITALASWCLSDNWLTNLPIDEAVPMLFRMGPDGREVRRRVMDGKEFHAEACRQSVGISTDEPIAKLPKVRRVYVFHPKAWTEQSVRKVFSEVGP